MKKTSLFIKIYMGFWLTIVVTAVPFFFIERMIFIKPMMKEWHSRVDMIIQFHARESADIYSRNGSEALSAYFVRLEKATGIKGYLFDEKRNEVTGQAVPREIRLQISSYPVKNKPTYVRMKDGDVASLSISIPGKTPLTFAARMPHPGPPGPPPPNIRNPLENPSPGPPAGMEQPKPPSQEQFLPSPGGPPHFLPPNFLIRLVFWLLVSAIICYLLARYLTTPIFKLGHAARQLADGNLSVRVSPELGRRRDELSSLAGDFDVMAERIEKLLTSQRNLLRDVSHELRSPLARLNVALELCRQNLSPEEEKHLDRISLETERLNELIGQILTYNKINAGTVDLQKTKFDLSDVIEEVAADANYEVRSSRVTVGSNESFPIEGNYDYLRRAIENIIRNAVYHTPEESPVEVFTARIADKDKSLIRITVRDHGRGVPEDTLPLIFKPFFKIPASDQQYKTGAGLGLAISEAAVRFHNGDIRARNAQDGGLIIEIVLPLENNY